MVWGQIGLPGIVWDPREPPPPHLRHLHNPAPFRDANRYHRQEWGPREPRDEPARFRHQADEALGVAPDNVPATDDGFLPPVSVSVSASITHDTAKVTVTQLFINNTNCLIPKAGYTFPLPPESTVIDFSCRIGRDKVLIGKVKPKAAARETFEEAVRQDQTAGLLDQNSPELFTTTLGNIPADTRLKATLSFIVLLKRSLAGDNREAHMTFVLPMYIAPRYGTPPGDLSHLLGRSANLTGLSVSVDILAATNILALTSPSHINSDIQIGVATRQRWVDFVANLVTQDPRCAIVRLRDDTNYLHRDFTLDICTTSTAVPEKPFACLEKHPELPGQSALMVTIPPKYLIGPSREYPGGEIVFIADRSGSMSDKMDALKRAMEFFLAALPSGCSFNIWSFGTSFSPLWTHSQPYNAATRQTAQAHVMSQFHADLGGTQILNVLKKVVANRGGFANTDVIVLTDGQIWDLEDTIKFVKQTRLQTEGRVRFFSLGIGNAVSHELVEGIAKAGGGYAEVIQTASQGGWEGRILAVLDSAKEHHVFPSSITLEWGDENDEVHIPDDSGNEALQSPHEISMLSPFMRNRVFMLLNRGRESAAPRAAWITCSRPGLDEERVEVPITFAQVPDTTIHKFAARALLGDLERGESRIHAQPNAPIRASAEETELVRLEGEKLGCRWSLVSKWTSFVAVEETLDENRMDEDSFMDGDREEGRGAGEGRGLNLLRHRGDQNVARRIEGHAQQIGSDDESSDSDGDESDVVLDRNEDSQDDGSDDSDDDQGPGHGGQGYGNADQGDASPGPRSDRDGSHRENRSHSGPERDPGGQSGSSPSTGGENSRVAVVHGVNILHVSTTKNLESPMQYRDRSSGVYQTKDTKTSTRPSNEPSHKSFHEPCHEPSYESFHEPSHPKIKLKGYPKPTGIRARRGRDDDALSKTAKKSTVAKEPSTVSQITVPRNNLPTAPAIQFANPVSSTDPVELGKRELIRLLLPLQDSDSGMFYKQDPGGTEVTMESVLGKDCEAFVVTSIVEYRKIVPRLASTPHFFQDAISRTMLVLWLLRLYFRSCLDLWKWMEEKAQRYIKERLLADEQIRVEDFARIHLAKATFNLGHDPYKYLRAEDVATARGAPAFIQIPLPNSGTGSSATGIQTLVSLPAEPPNIANQDGTSPAQPQRDADFLTETTWDWKSLSAPNRDLTPTTSFRTETTSQQLPDDSMDFESTPAPSSDEKIRPGQPEAMAPFPHESTSTGHKNQDEKVTSLVTPRPTTPGRIVLEPTPTSSEILYTFRSEHENLIRRIAAEREARSSVGGEETEVPEDI